MRPPRSPGEDGEIQFDVDEEHVQTVVSTPDGEIVVGSGALPDPATEAHASALAAAGFEQQMMTESNDGSSFAFVTDAWTVSGGLYPTASAEGSDIGITVSRPRPDSVGGPHGVP